MVSLAGCSPPLYLRGKEQVLRSPELDVELLQLQAEPKTHPEMMANGSARFICHAAQEMWNPSCAHLSLNWMLRNPAGKVSLK